MLEPTIDGVPLLSAPTGALIHFIAQPGAYDWNAGPHEPKDVAASIAVAVLADREGSEPGAMR